jgi:hypothetical protein
LVTPSNPSSPRFESCHGTGASAGERRERHHSGREVTPETPSRGRAGRSISRMIIEWVLTTCPFKRRCHQRCWQRWRSACGASVATTQSHVMSRGVTRTDAHICAQREGEPMRAAPENPPSLDETSPRAAPTTSSRPCARSQRLEARRARNAERMRRKRCRDDAKSRYVTRSDAH